MIETILTLLVIAAILAYVYRALILTKADIAPAAAVAEEKPPAINPEVRPPTCPEHMAGSPAGQRTVAGTRLALAAGWRMGCSRLLSV